MNETLRKEIYVALHGQTARFRMVKYIVLLAVFGAIYWRFGGKVVGWTLLVALILALAMHFFFRWKTKGWMEDFGPYKSLFK